MNNPKKTARIKWENNMAIEQTQMYFCHKNNLYSHLFLFICAVSFLKFQAYAPEMFILEATADIRALPDSGSVSAQSQTSFQNGYHSDSGSFSSHSRVPPIKSHAVAVQTGKWQVYFFASS